MHLIKTYKLRIVWILVTLQLNILKGFLQNKNSSVYNNDTNEDFVNNTIMSSMQKNTTEFHQTYSDYANSSATDTVEDFSQNNAQSIQNKSRVSVLNSINEFAPKFTKNEKLLSNIQKFTGASVKLTCFVNGTPDPEITWSRNNDISFTRSFGLAKRKKNYLEIDDLIKDDSGNYKCMACNKLGCVEHITKLTVIDRLRSRPILSDKFPYNQTVLVNRSATFECKVLSSGLEPFIYWIRFQNTTKNVNVEDLRKDAEHIDYRNYTCNGKCQIFERDSDKPHILHINNVTHAHEGWYACVAATNLGNATGLAYLKVVEKLPMHEVYTLFRSHPIWIIIAAIVIVLLLLLGTIFIIYVLRKLKHEKMLKHRIETVHQWTKKVIIYKPSSTETNNCNLVMPIIKIEKQRTTFETLPNMESTQTFNEYEFPLDSKWEIPRNQLTLGSTLGEGAFGRVVMAKVSTQFNGSTVSDTLRESVVAVKMVKDEHTDADMTSLVREMECMKLIGKHKNIINLIGCCTIDGPLWVVVEFAPHGNLKDFLKRNFRVPMLGYHTSVSIKNTEGLTEKDLLSFAYQIARGMAYLASRRCIHRDLAARNVLVSDDLVMKIADFGLARDIQDTNYYRKNTNGRLPIKWMAPESLQEKFYDSKSDVYSYGVLLYEIMTFGEQPYPNIASAEELYQYLLTGQRMEKPMHCSLNIYLLMRQCWNFDANARPTFTELVENLDKILQTSTGFGLNEGYLDFSITMLETPPSSDNGSDIENSEDSSKYQCTYKFS